ncbi:hypothetical protein GCM10007036_07950 [Alsobacter metallidurans]|uniref:Cysteine rich repeat protein n=1 Tax=Alsobacter metallidurans TaxID=340221 RepID=A0A917I4T4_9HYPH|nr:cysteine rich repeat-containing protein [Alsobacter metallidurans]GGH11099.1 hypothetical protein GCM10007036_07950 [Alsobacter metallidurans]
MRSVILPALVALACLTGGLPASAQTISFGEAYDRLAHSCGRDIEKFCGNTSLGGGAVKACLEKNQARVSAGCRQTQAETFGLLAKRMNAQAVAIKVCDRDMQQYCRGVQPHDGYLLSCLLKASKVVGPSCKQVIVDAGWDE